MDDKLEEYLKGLVKSKHPDCDIAIVIDESKERKRFWIDVLSYDFSKEDKDFGPVVEQYVLVPLSKIQDRLEIELEFDNAIRKDDVK